MKSVMDRKLLETFLSFMSMEKDHRFDGEDDVLLDEFEIALRQKHSGYDHPSVPKSDYDLDEEGNKLSCCGDILDEDVMMCPSCGEHN